MTLQLMIQQLMAPLWMAPLWMTPQWMTPPMMIHMILLMIFMGLLIRTDMARFEIEFAALAMVALNGAALNIHLGQSPLEMALGLLIWIVAALAVRIFKTRNALGQGDVYLFAVIGLVAGTGGTPVALLLFVLISLATSYAYARARGRKMARSLTPAALPGGLAIIGILMGRLMGLSLFNGFEPASAPDTALGGSILTYGPWVAVILAPCAIILMRMDRKSRDRQNRNRRVQHG